VAAGTVALVRLRSVGRLRDGLCGLWLRDGVSRIQVSAHGFRCPRVFGWESLALSKKTPCISGNATGGPRWAVATLVLISPSNALGVRNSCTNPKGPLGPAGSGTAARPGWSPCVTRGRETLAQEGGTPVAELPRSWARGQVCWYDSDSVRPHCGLSASFPGSSGPQRPRGGSAWLPWAQEGQL